MRELFICKRISTFGVFIYFFVMDLLKIISDILQNVSREMRNRERVKETIKGAKPVRGFEKRKSRGNPAGPYENLASNSVLNLIKTRNPPRGRPRGTVVRRDRGNSKGRKERGKVGKEKRWGSRWLQGCHPNYLWLDKKNELKKRMRWGRGWAARDSQLIGVFKSLHWSPGPR